jgi:hypothetical protein
MLFREITDVCSERSRRGRGGEWKTGISHPRPDFYKINKIEKSKYIKYYVLSKILFTFRNISLICFNIQTSCSRVTHSNTVQGLVHMFIIKFSGCCPYPVENLLASMVLRIIRKHTEKNTMGKKAETFLCYGRWST